MKHRTAKTRIVIAGGGFAGLYAAKEFERALGRRADIEVTLISRENFILFTPMLHEVNEHLSRIRTRTNATGRIFESESFVTNPSSPYAIR